MRGAEPRRWGRPRGAGRFWGGERENCEPGVGALIETSLLPPRPSFVWGSPHGTPGRDNLGPSPHLGLPERSVPPAVPVASAATC